MLAGRRPPPNVRPAPRMAHAMSQRAPTLAAPLGRATMNEAHLSLSSIGRPDAAPGRPARRQRQHARRARARPGRRCAAGRAHGAAGRARHAGRGRTGGASSGGAGRCRHAGIDAAGCRAGRLAVCRPPARGSQPPLRRQPLGRGDARVDAPPGRQPRARAHGQGDALFIGPAAQPPRREARVGVLQRRRGTSGTRVLAGVRALAAHP